MNEINALNKRAKYQILSGYALKMIGIVLMVGDHIHQMFYIMGAPLWLKMAGRLVAPIFLFLAAEGFAHTHSRKKYLLRLWAGYVAMSLMSTLLQRVLPLDGVMLLNSIFGTLFLCALYMWLTDIVRDGFRQKRYGKMALGIAGMLIPILLTFALVALVQVNTTFVLVFNVLVPTPLMVEGGFIWIALGVLFYLLRKNRWLQMIPLTAIALLYFVMGDFQWMMVFAAIPLLMYNEQRGKKSKHFFYIFYPAHIYALYILSYIVQRVAG